MARPKTEYAKDVEILKKQARMIKQGTEMLEERWPEVINAMLDVAIKKKSVMAATWLRDTFIGKPVDVVVQKEDNSDTPANVFSVPYTLDKLNNVIGE